MPTAQPDAAVLALLEAITSPVALDAGRNLFYGPAYDPEATHPAESVFVLGTGGPTNARFCGTSTDWREYTVQVMIRADRSNYTGGQSLARACLDACHCATVSGYVDCQVREPDPTYLRIDTRGRHLWSINVRLWRAK